MGTKFSVGSGGAAVLVFGAAAASCALAGASSGQGFGGGGGTANSGGGSTAGSGPGAVGGSPSSTSGSGGGGIFTEMSCDEASYMVGLDAHGKIVCKTIDDSAQRAINGACSAYLGWRDGCAGPCSLGPASWGGASDANCVVDNTPPEHCDDQTPLGGDDVNLAAIRLGGNVSADDHFYAGLHCTEPPDPPPHALPCADDEAVVGVNQGVIVCQPVARAAVDFVRQRCGLAFGWKDMCDNCQDPPSTLGLAGDKLPCIDQGGTNDACKQETLGTETMYLFDLNTSGNVGGNDNFYIGLSCDQAPNDAGHAATQCDPGEFAVGTHADGKVECKTIDGLTYAYFRRACRAYLGWTDCGDNCMAPDKWGYATVDMAVDGTPGLDDVTIVASLGEVSVQLFGVNLDGNADQSDSLFVGFTCR